MQKEKAAMFIDNSNIFLGMQKFGKFLIKNGILQEGKYLRMNWTRLIDYLEKQDGGIDIFARHFFASLPPAADVGKLKKRPTEEEWSELVKKSAQSGFYKAVQEPPYNFTMHGIPLRFAEVFCNKKIIQAHYKCKESQGGDFKCNLKINLDECKECLHKFLLKYEKGVDVALAVQLIIFGVTKEKNVDRIILVAGDGDYQEAAKYIRKELGKDFQIVSWGKSLSRDLSKIGNKQTIVLDDHWKDFCEIRSMAPLEEAPVESFEVEIKE